MWKRTLIGLAPVIALTLALHGCGDDTPTSLPEGPQTMTGVLIPVPLSIVRRGTHIVQQNGENVFYAESSTVDLRDYEHMDAVFEGVLEYNTDPEDVPVLLISGATLIAMQMHSIDIPSISLSLEVPETWSVTQYDDGAQFTQTGSRNILLSVHTSSLTQLPSGSMTQLAGARAVRIAGTGAQLVYVQRARNIIVLEFKENGEGDSVEERTRQHILRSIIFRSALPSSKNASGDSSVTQSSSVVAGAPCGGLAGVLCPQGQYCEVIDALTNIGRCRALKH